MLAAEADQLHIGEAEPDGVDSDEDLILRARRYVDPLGFAVASNAVHALPVNIPSKRAARGIRRDEAIGGVGLAHSRAFGRGRSAALSTRPVGSRIPTFVPIVSGLAAKRSPGLIATQRYPGSGASRLIAGPISAPVAATLIRPRDVTRSASPSGSGAASSDALIAVRSAS